MKSVKRGIVLYAKKRYEDKNYKMDKKSIVSTGMDCFAMYLAFIHWW